jgi:hypothetical protein
LRDPVLAPSDSMPLPGTSIELLRLDGPATRTAVSHELVITTTGGTGYLAPGTTLDVAAGTTAYLATG